jgi:hypothetical protein
MTATVPRAVGRWRRKILALQTLGEVEGHDSGTVFSKGIHIVVSVKVKLSLCFLTTHHAMNAYWGSGGIAPLIL